MEGGRGPTNSRAIEFKGHGIEKIRVLADDLCSDPSKVINHILEQLNGF
jgi:hypothetical protein